MIHFMYVKILKFLVPLSIAGKNLEYQYETKLPEFMGTTTGFHNVFTSFKKL